MLNRIAAVVVSVLIVVPALAAADGAPSLKLQFDLEPSVTLPGIPVSFRFTFTNESDRPQPIPRRYALVISDPSGNRFVAGWGMVSEVRVMTWPIGPPSNDAPPPARKLPPHQTAVLEVPTRGQMGEPDSIGSGEFASPGTYQLQAWVIDSVRASWSEEEVRQRAIVTNTAVLTVEEPKGKDAAVWTLMLQLAHGAWHPGVILNTGNRKAAADLVRRVLTDYPQSTYTGWLVTSMVLPREEQIARMKEWLAQTAPDNLTPWRQYWLAWLELGQTGQRGVLTPKQIAAYAKDVRTLVKTIQANTKSDLLRSEAQDLVDQLDDPSDENP